MIARFRPVFWVIAAYLIPCACRAATAAVGQPPVILISVDTLRADRLSCYGYRGLNTRHIDAIAQGGTLFQQAASHVPLTLPSHVSLLTSTYPFFNGVRDNGEQVSDKLSTLASVFKSRGYRTAGFIGGFVLDRRFGLTQGFDLYDSAFDVQGDKETDSGDLKRPAERVTASAMKWLEANSSAPFFLFVHLFDLHTPYILPPAVRARFPQAGYDAALSYVDDTLGRFWDFLEKKELTRRALIVFLADHGESLGDHGEHTHGFFVYQSTMRVPLIIHWPAGAPPSPPRVDQPVGLVDIAPSILEYLGIPRPAQFQGRSALDFVRGKAPLQEREIYGESLYAHNHLGCAALMTLRTGRYKYVDAPKPELYDLAQDPHELRNVYEGRRTIAAPFQKRLATIRKIAPAPAAERKPLAPEAVQKLRSLGYLAGGDRAGSLAAGADPKDKIADYEMSRQAIVLSLSNRLPEAVALFESVLSRNPDFLDARNIMGLTQQKLGKHEDAIRTFKRVLEKDPANLPAHYNIGLSYTELRQLDPAVKELEAAVAIGASSGHAADQMTIPAEELLGRIALERKDYQGSRTHFDKLLLLAPDNFTAHYNLGWLATLQGNSQEGLRHLQAAIQSDPENSMAHDALGNLYLRMGDLDRAHSEFEQAVRLNPKDAWGHYNLGVVFGKRNDRAQAAAEFRKALDSDPSFTAAGDALKRLENSPR